MATGTGKKILSGVGLSFVTALVNAKENGEQLPPFLDKLANVAVKSKSAIKDAAIETAKDEANKRMAWIVAGGLAITLGIVLLKRK